ncbi:hypothetical protein OGY83_17740 [Citrobacter sp. Cpo090]|uniref:hypothetical protein n=1 Tax=Citrobacter sp. Cpo090 TaxID=2985139 RepID=UPI00257902F5|nr:hypothetical protein [Citrobacter sp. Cpo090]MDM2845465.1 hypothetical protein [Citrobacter sp. Cpo090]
MRTVIQLNNGFDRKITGINDNKIAVPLRNLPKQRKPFPSTYPRSDLDNIDKSDLSHDKQVTAGESRAKLSEKHAFPICQKTVAADSTDAF